MLHKPKTIQIILLILLMVIISKTSTNAQIVDQYSEIQYKEVDGADPHDLSLDIYTNPQESKQRVLIYIHGGGFISGSKEIVGQKVPALMEAGYVLVSINYRLYPEVTIPTIIQDTAAAVAWVYNNIEYYGGDSDRIYIQGHSSGAHICALVSTDGRYLREHALTLNVIKGFNPSDNSGYDIHLLASFYGGYFYGMFGGIFTADYEYWKYISPVTYAKPGDNLPPLIVGFSKIQDPTLSQHFSYELNYAGYCSTILDAWDKDHGTIDYDFGVPDDHITTETLGFFEHTTPFTRLSFNKDYYPETTELEQNITYDAENIFLEAHKRTLFAGIESSMNNENYSRSSQILVKKSIDSDWSPDFNLDKSEGNGSVCYLKSITFLSDKDGNLLEPPVSILFSGYRSGSSEAKVYTRNDDNEVWTETVIEAHINDKNRAYVSLITDHFDMITGVHYVFAASANSGLYRGTYDPDSPGQIKWDIEPALMCSKPFNQSTSANGVLYLAAGSNGISDDNDGGIYMLNVGPESVWEHVYEWEGKSDLTGLKGVPDPYTEGREVLIFSRENSGLIERLNPETKLISIDFDYKAYFETIWEEPVDNPAYAFIVNAPDIYDPSTGDKSALIGLRVSHPEGFTHPYNGSHYLVRHKDGNYVWGYIFDPDNSYDDSCLSACRTIAISPFTEDKGKALYFGGLDSGSMDDSVQSTAWIYKGKSFPNECKSMPVARLDIHSKHKWVSKGDTLDIELIAENYSTGKIELYAALVYEDKYYWYPTWTISPDAITIDGNTSYTEKILSVLITEDIMDMMKELTFVAAITEHQTLNIIDTDYLSILIE